MNLAVAVADGAECLSGIAVLAGQAELLGPVVSDSTCWRTFDAIGAAIDAARAWAQRAELTDLAYSPAWAAGRALPGLVIDLDTTVMVCDRSGFGARS
ncbi:MAG TPA: hypothetical protein VFO16_07495 [Pseudonocardiaceae bacterium]|nr:hypothetical protein [Pseudonocardiaceae bacterium]